jgi:hypothetical protein
MTLSDKHSQSAYASIRVSFDPNSNVNDESELHMAKERFPRRSTDAGRQIDCNDEQPWSAYASIRASFDPDSNVNEESDLQHQKDFSPRNSTEAGRKIDLRDEHS